MLTTLAKSRSELCVQQGTCKFATLFKSSPHPTEKNKRKYIQEKKWNAEMCHVCYEAMKLSIPQFHLEIKNLLNSGRVQRNENVFQFSIFPRLFMIPAGPHSEWRRLGPWFQRLTHSSCLGPPPIPPHYSSWEARYCRCGPWPPPPHPKPSPNHKKVSLASCTVAIDDSAASTLIKPPCWLLNLFSFFRPNIGLPFLRKKFSWNCVWVVSIFSPEPSYKMHPLT